MTDQSLRETYEAVPYASDTFPETNPSRMSGIATLFGMAPRDVRSCRVLELGCGGGNNLIALAAAHPGSEFVGIDFANARIEEGKKFARAAGIDNVNLRAVDLSTLDATEGLFDYIIAHGLFSWVSTAVQEKILSLLDSLLAQQGIAYVSYNAYPGWHLKNMMRDALRFHNAGIEDPATRVKRARAFADLTVRTLKENPTPLAKALSDHYQTIQSMPDWYLFHDLLEVENHPMYLSDFVSRAAQHNLRYVGDAAVEKMTPQDLPQIAQQSLPKLGTDPVRLEQYFDFYRNEGFRRTLLCKATTTLRRDTALERIPLLYLASSVAMGRNSVTITDDSPLELRLSRGISAETDEPALKGALIVLSEAWPATLSFAELELAVGERFRQEGSGPPSHVKLREAVFRAVLGGIILLHGDKIDFVPDSLPERPVLSRLNRVQAITQRAITSIHHVPIEADEIIRRVVSLADGTRTVEEIEQELAIDKSVTKRLPVSAIIQELSKNAIRIS